MYTLPPIHLSSEISFHSLSYALKIKKKEKTILDNVSGVFGNPGKGEMIAIMGQSGAGTCVCRCALYC
jgi:ABC-type multidrug transport system ATPase subunit